MSLSQRQSGRLLALVWLIGVGCDSDRELPHTEIRYVRAPESTSSSRTSTTPIDEPAKEVRFEVTREDGRTISLFTRDAAALLELVRSLKAEGKSDSEIESGTIYLEGGEAISLKEILSSVARHAKSAETVFETIRYLDTPGERGYGRVLLAGKVPRKALARRDDVQILDERGFPKRLMKSSTPFFVFEDTGEHWLVGSEQDRDLAIGWVRSDHCFAWPTRRLVYPIDLEALSAALDVAGVGAHLPPFRAEDVMPWPVISEDRDTDSLTVLADLSPIGGGIMPMHIAHTEQFELYVLFSEKELNLLLARLTELVGFLESGRLSLPQIVQVLGDFLTQNRIDFLDFPEMQKVVDLYPGGRTTLLFEVELQKEIKRVLPKLRDQIAVLLDAVAARDFFNSAHGLYILPMGKFRKGDRP